MHKSVLLGAVTTALLLLANVQARAETLEYGGEKYQSNLTDRARIENKLEYEPNPAGKLIERIVTVPNDVILPDELYPQFLNWFHVTTVPEVVERELLFHEGETWIESRVVESAHNLRTYLFLTSAQIVACKGSAPDRVVALVVTKDLWSLRPNLSFVYVGSQFEHLDAQLTEQNFAGRMKSATIDLGMDLFSWYWGLAYQDPRLLGSELSLLQRGDLIWNRSTGSLEGGVANITLQQPLYTLDTEWGWITSVQYRQDVFRLLADGGLGLFLSPATGGTIPYVFNRHALDFQAGVTRSFGHDLKRDFTAGYRSFVHIYSVPALNPPVSSATQADFELRAVPLTENAGMLYVGFQAYEGGYRELIDINSFALTEEFRLGLNFSTELRLANPAFGFSSSFLEPVIGLAWSQLAHDNLFLASSALDIRYQPELGTDWVDGLASAELRDVSPRFSVMRLHTDVRIGRRFNDFNHGITTLGGDTSLRGFPTAYLVGANFWAANAELRTIPIAFLSVHMGLAAFLDMGAASDDITQLSPHESVGGGLRFGLPQFNKEVLRVDFGFPLETLYNATPAYIVAQYGQAF